MTTVLSTKESRPLLASLSLKARIAQCCARTHRLTPSQWLRSLRSPRTCAPKLTPGLISKSSSRSPLITFLQASPIRHRATTYCTIARVARSHGKKQCKCLKRKTLRASRCTHAYSIGCCENEGGLHALYSMNARARPLKVLKRFRCYKVQQQACKGWRALFPQRNILCESECSKTFDSTTNFAHFTTGAR